MWQVIYYFTEVLKPIFIFWTLTPNLHISKCFQTYLYVGYLYAPWKPFSVELYKGSIFGLRPSNLWMKSPHFKNSKLIQFISIRNKTELEFFYVWYFEDDIHILDYMINWLDHILSKCPKKGQIKARKSVHTRFRT